MKIVFLDEYTVGGADLSSIKSMGEYVGYDNTEPQDVVERCAEAQVVITNKVPISADDIARLPKLRLICVAATGVNNIDRPAAAKARIEVRNAKGYSTNAVAESAFSGVLALMKQTLYMDNFVKSGEYAASDRLFHFGRPTEQLYGKSWGIIGLGDIGYRVADLAHSFGCRIRYYSTSGKNDNPVYQRVSLDDLLAKSDIVSVHAPLNETTDNLLDAARIAQMKKGVIVVNVGRGRIVNEQALADALNSGHVRGAVLDVYSQEPIESNNPILSVKDKYSLVLSPHSAWATSQTLQMLVGKVAENIRHFYEVEED